MHPHAMWYHAGDCLLSWDEEPSRNAHLRVVLGNTTAAGAASNTSAVGNPSFVGGYWRWGNNSMPPGPIEPPVDNKTALQNSEQGAT